MAAGRSTAPGHATGAAGVTGSRTVNDEPPCGRRSPPARCRRAARRCAGRSRGRVRGPSRVEPRSPCGTARTRAAGTPDRCPARVGDAKLRATTEPRSHVTPAFRRELDRVREQVPRHLLQPASSPPRAVVGRSHLDRHALGRRGRPDRDERRMHDGPQVERRQGQRECPCVSRETSSRSSMSRACTRALRSMASTARARSRRGRS